MSERTALEHRTKARIRAEKALGKAVHPRALDRLFEIWPAAHVRVRHGKILNMKWTRVSIRVSARASMGGFSATADCAPGDQWNRQFGIALAFRRALKKVSRFEKEHPEELPES
jgi:hypothetical protein